MIEKPAASWHDLLCNLTRDEAELGWQRMERWSKHDVHLDRSKRSKVNLLGFLNLFVLCSLLRVRGLSDRDRVIAGAGKAGQSLSGQEVCTGCPRPTEGTMDGNEYASQQIATPRPISAIDFCSTEPRSTKKKLI